jgi:hypothetical protein
MAKLPVKQKNQKTLDTFLTDKSSSKVNRKKAPTSTAAAAEQSENATFGENRKKAPTSTAAATEQSENATFGEKRKKAPTSTAAAAEQSENNGNVVNSPRKPAAKPRHGNAGRLFATMGKKNGPAKANVRGKKKRSAKANVRGRGERASAAAENEQENTAVNSHHPNWPSQSKARKRTPNLCVGGNFNPIVFQVLKRLIDNFTNNGTDKIVNIAEFVTACQRTLESLPETIQTEALSMGYKLGKDSKSRKLVVHENGLSFRMNTLEVALKKRLTVLAEHPHCKSLMVILVIAFP